MSKYIPTEDGQFECPNCGVKKRHRSTMFYHIPKCTGNNNNICTICNSTFYSKHGLDVHMQIRHKGHVAAAPAPAVTQIQLFECPFKECTFKPNTKGNCRVHCMRIHFANITQKYIKHLEHDYMCTLCNTNFSSSTHYYYHIHDCVTKNAEADVMALSDDLFTGFMSFAATPHA